METLGFRGEGLHAIATQGSLKITSRERGANVGYAVTLDQMGKLQGEPEVLPDAPFGTKVEVRKLFASVPVRRQVLEEKRERAVVACIQMFTAYSLVHPEVSFSLEAPPRSPFKAPGKSSFQDRFIDLFGPTLWDEMECMEFCSTDDDYLWKVSCVLPRAGKSEFQGGVRSKGDRSFLFVNKRPVDLPLFSKAINRIFRAHSGIGKNRFPFTVVHFTLPPETYDINVSVDKRKVHLKYESQLMEFLKANLEDKYPSKTDTQISSSGSSPRVVLAEGVGGALVADNIDSPINSGSSSSSATPKRTTVVRELQMEDVPQRQPLPPVQLAIDLDAESPQRNVAIVEQRQERRTQEGEVIVMESRVQGNQGFQQEPRVTHQPRPQQQQPNNQHNQPLQQQNQQPTQQQQPPQQPPTQQSQSRIDVDFFEPVPTQKKTPSGGVGGVQVATKKSTSAPAQQRHVIDDNNDEDVVVVKRQKTLSGDFVDLGNTLSKDLIDIHLNVVRAQIGTWDAYDSEFQRRQGPSVVVSSFVALNSLQLLTSRVVGMMKNPQDGFLVMVDERLLVLCHSVAASEALNLRQSVHFTCLNAKALGAPVFIDFAFIGSPVLWSLVRTNAECQRIFQKNGFVFDPAYFDTRVNEEVIMLTHTAREVELTKLDFLELLKMVGAAAVEQKLDAKTVLHPKRVMEYFTNEAQRIARSNIVSTVSKAQDLLEAIAVSKIETKDFFKSIFEVKKNF